jgi:hypothetical protein
LGYFRCVVTMVVARCILMYGVLERKISTNEPG